MPRKAKQDTKVAVTSQGASERFVWRRKHLLGLQELTRQELIHILAKAGKNHAVLNAEEPAK